MEVDFIKPFNFATAQFGFKWAGKKQNCSSRTRSPRAGWTRWPSACRPWWADPTRWDRISWKRFLFPSQCSACSWTETLLALLCEFSVETELWHTLKTWTLAAVHSTLGWWKIDIDIRFIPIRAPKTKMIQMMMKASMAVRPSALGILLVMLLKMLTRHRKTVTRMVIRPGTLSGGTRKLIQDTMTNIPVGK